MSDEVTQVYLVTSGEYSDYRVDSIWLSLEEAEANCGSDGSVEVYPIGDNKPTLGTFSRSGDVHCRTGEFLNEDAQYWNAIENDVRVDIICWPEHIGYYKDRIGIRVRANTQERADKVYAEVRARVLADIDLGLPAEVIAKHKYDPEAYPNPWVPT